MKNFRDSISSISLLLIGLGLVSISGCSNVPKSIHSNQCDGWYQLPAKFKNELLTALEAETEIRPVEIVKGRFCLSSPVSIYANVVPFVGPLIYGASDKEVSIEFTAKIGEKLVAVEGRTKEENALAAGSIFYKNISKMAVLKIQ